MPLVIGQKVLYLSGTALNPSKQVVTEAVITKITPDSVQLDGKDWYYTAFVYPDIPEVRELFADMIALAVKQEEENTTMLKRQFALGNALKVSGQR